MRLQELIDQELAEVDPDFLITDSKARVRATLLGYV